MTERSGIEIDYCPSCRGVWLDRGELDKIVERSATPTAPATAPVGAGLPLPANDRGGHDDRRGRRDGRDARDEHTRPVADAPHGRPKKKRSSIFEDLFDF